MNVTMIFFVYLFILILKLPVIYVRLTNRVSPTNGADSHKQADPTNGPKISNEIPQMGRFFCLDVRDMNDVSYKNMFMTSYTYKHRHKSAGSPK